MKADSMAVLGLQWGDEGKGKIIDFLSDQCDAVARFGGGANAGHTIVVDGEKYILKLLPSGILREGKLCFVGAGVACDPEVLQREISELESRGISTGGRIFIDFGAQLVLPLHKVSDGYRDAGRGKGALDTTKRGIGPAYADRASRVGIRVADLFDQESLERKIGIVIDAHISNLGKDYDESVIDKEQLTRRLLGYRPMFQKLACDVGPRIMELIDAGKKVMFEGAQGALLDLDFGTYPYVTSSHTTTGGIFTGLGIPPSYLGSTVGIFKAYMTRVGHGPFPTEITGQFGDILRERGGEYGSVTGRPRRVGWLDLANLKRMIKLNGIDRLAITKLDVLDGLDEIKVSEAYEIAGKRINGIPSNHPDFGAVKPVYTLLDGWKEPTAGISKLEGLPHNARAYLDYISGKVGVPIWLISTGFSRTDTIIVDA
jgi:adenylosuccinate synthase